MSNHDRSIAADVQRSNLKLLDKATAYWYACGYNDHRQPETGRIQPYVDPQAFAEYWLTVSAQPSHSSLQDAFKAFKHGIQCRHCGRPIVLDDGVWVDPEATGDDSVWRETCDAHDTFTAEHEPVTR